MPPVELEDLGHLAVLGQAPGQVGDLLRHGFGVAGVGRDGDDWVITGHKTWATSAPVAPPDFSPIFDS